MSKVVRYTDANKSRKYCNEEVYLKVADKLGVSHQLVADIFKAQADFSVRTIKRGGFEGITYIYLGKLKPNLRAIPKILSIPKAKKD